MKLIDIHTHKIYSKEQAFGLYNYLIESSSTGFDGSVAFSTGVHPWHLNEAKLMEQFWQLDMLVRNPKCLAVGEIGLDKLCETPWELQQRAFRYQIEQAEKFHKPVIVHAVKTYSDILNFRKKSVQLIPWIIHGFNGSAQLAAEFTSKNCYLSFGSKLLGTNHKLIETLKSTDPSYLFFETDDNTDISIDDVYASAANILHISNDTLRKHIHNNFTRIFGNHINQLN